MAYLDGGGVTHLWKKIKDNFLAKGSQAADSSKLGGKAPQYYIQPHNLLDNSDFRNAVNQRGKDYYEGQVYGLDRWRGNSSSTAFSITGDGLLIATDTVVQILPDKHSGKSLTLAAMNEAGEVEIVSCTVASPDSRKWLCVVNNRMKIGIVQSDQGVLYIHIQNGTNASSRIIWAALYEGVYTADTLPPYIPKGYAAELAECQRYFTTGTGIVALPYSTADIVQTYICNIRYPIPMRTSPTVTVSNVMTWTNQSSVNIGADANIQDKNGFNSINLSETIFNYPLQIDYTASADL